MTIKYENRKRTTHTDTHTHETAKPHRIDAVRLQQRTQRKSQRINFFNIFSVHIQFSTTRHTDYKLLGPRETGSRPCHYIHVLPDDIARRDQQSRRTTLETVLFRYRNFDFGR